MKFDVIISNPPYQLSDGGNGVSAKPIYQHFISQAKVLSPRYIVMITPSRWFAGGKGLDSFREEMLNDTRIRKIVDFINAKDCFPQNSISGGVNYFLWDRDYNGDCDFTTVLNGLEDTESRYLGEFSVFVRFDAGWDDSLVIPAFVQRRGYYEIRRASVHGKRNIIKRCQSGEPHHIVLVPLHYQVVAEEDEHVYLALRNHGPNLEIPAKRTAQKAYYGRNVLTAKSGESLPHKPSRSTGAVEVALAKRACIVLHPAHEFIFPGVVSHKSNVFYHIFAFNEAKITFKPD